MAFLSKKPVPRALLDPVTPELPASPLYDPIRDTWYPVTIPKLVGYKAFPIQRPTQQIIATAGRQRNGCVPQEVSTAVVFRHEWSPSIHGAASHQVVKDLVSFCSTL